MASAVECSAAKVQYNDHAELQSRTISGEVLGVRTNGLSGVQVAAVALLVSALACPLGRLPQLLLLGLSA